MKSDIKGCSTCQPGEEKYEFFQAHQRFPKSKVLASGQHVQYDYRTEDGVLFSCIARHLPEARSLRDKWLKKREATPC